MRRVVLFACLWAVLAAPPLARSEDKPPTDESKTPPKKLEKIEVQAPNEVEQRRDSTAAKIVVKHDELIKYGDTTLLDAVKRLPGITVESDGRGGGTISMRGLGAYTQILLDGEPVPPGFSIETLSPDLVERIEIYRSATAEFSTQAIAGTINIVLRKVVSQRHEELKLGASMANGQVSTSASGELSDRAGALSYTAPVSIGTFHFHATEVAEQRGRDAQATPDLDYVTESPSRGWGEHIGLSPKLTWNLGKDHTLTWEPFVNYSGFTGTFDDRSRTYLGTPPTYASNNLWYTASGGSLRNGLAWSRRLDNDARIEARLGINYNHRTTQAIFDGFDDADTYILHRVINGHSTDDGVTLKGKYTFPLVAGHALVAGWDGEHARRTEDRLQVDATPDGTITADIDESYDARVNRLALFTQDDWDITSRASLYLGLRWEGIDTRSTGNTFAQVKTRSGVWSPIVQALWRLPGTEKDQLRAGLARTYKAPNTFDLMPRRYIANNNSATTPDFQGNPGLQPELAWGLDLAYEHYFAGGGVFSASAYERRIDSVILRELLDVNGTFITRPANEGRAEVKGIELDTKFNLATLVAGAPSVDVHANVSHHWSSVDYLPGPDNRLAQQIRWSANVGLDYKLAARPLTIGGNFGFHTGGPVRISLTQTTYTSASRNLDLYGLWKISPAAELRVYANNLLRQEHLRIDGYADDTGSLELTTIGPSYRHRGVHRSTSSIEALRRRLAQPLRDRLGRVVFPAQPRDLPGGKALHVHVVALPRIGLAPAQRVLHRGARARRRLERGQRQLERGFLGSAVVRPARRVAEREVAEDQARHAAMLDDVECAAHHHGRDAVRLEVARGETERLVADGAIGDEHSGIGGVLAQPREELRHVGLEHVALAAVAGHAVEAFRQRADPSAPRRLAQERQREPRAAVLHAGVHAVDLHVGDAHVVVDRAVARVHAVELHRGVVRRAGALRPLARLVRRRGGDQRNGGARERPRQPMERDVVVMRPAIGIAVAQREVPVARALHVGDRWRGHLSDTQPRAASRSDRGSRVPSVPRPHRARRARAYRRSPRAPAEYPAAAAGPGGVRSARGRASRT